MIFRPALPALLLAGAAALLFLLAVESSPSPPDTPSLPEARVEVLLRQLDELDRIPCQVDGDFAAITPDGRTVLTGSGLNGYLSATTNAFLLGPWILDDHPFTLVPRGCGALRLNHTSYTGSLSVSRAADGGLRLVLATPMELYLAGVVSGEMPANQPGAAEALRAQAIAARSYALYRIAQRGGPLRDDETDQVFLGREFVTDAAIEAVRSTRGLVLSWQDRIVPGFYSASCGGGTEDAAQVDFISKPLAPLAGVPCRSCAEENPWHRVVPAERLDRMAQERAVGSYLKRIVPLRRELSGRWAAASLTGEWGESNLNGEALRRATGTPSALWRQIAPQPDGSLSVRGRGHGHGVGLCQAGALAMARQGADAEEILAHYFPGAALRSHHLLAR